MGACTVEGGSVKFTMLLHFQSLTSILVSFGEAYLSSLERISAPVSEVCPPLCGSAESRLLSLFCSRYAYIEVFRSRARVYLLATVSLRCTALPGTPYNFVALTATPLVIALLHDPLCSAELLPVGTLSKLPALRAASKSKTISCHPGLPLMRNMMMMFCGGGVVVISRVVRVYWIYFSLMFLLQVRAFKSILFLIYPASVDLFQQRTA